MRSNKIEEVLNKDKSHKGFTLAKNRPFAQIPWATQESLKKIERFNAILCVILQRRRMIKKRQQESERARLSKRKNHY